MSGITYCSSNPDSSGRRQDLMMNHANACSSSTSATTNHTSLHHRQRRSSVSESIRNSFHNAADKAANFAENIVQMLTTTFDDAPAWMKDNPSITSGYRRELQNYYDCAKSLFYLHNEFVNIWSHVIGTAVFVVVASNTYELVFEKYNTVHWTDYFAFYTFFFGAMICLGLSSTFHALSCHSQKISEHFNKLDYVGIVVLIVFSVYPAIYYGFYCHINLQLFYIGLITTLGSATMVVALAEKYQSIEYRIFRTSIFVSLGFSGIIPVCHSILMYGWDNANRAMAFGYLFTMGFLYVMGAVIYANRIPERFWPGKFDIWGHSHQIFHGFVVAAAVTHFFALWKMFNTWHSGELHCKKSF